MSVKVQWEEETGKKVSISGSAETPVETLSKTLGKIFSEIETTVTARGG